MTVEVAGVACALCGALELTMTLAGEAYCLECFASPVGEALRHLVAGIDLECAACLAQRVQ